MGLDLTLNGTVLPKSGMKASFMPVDVKKTFQMASGGKTIDIVAQKDGFLVNYSITNHTDYSTVKAIWKTADSVTVAYNDTDGNPMSFSAYMSPPVARIEQVLDDGTWQIEGVSFTLEEL